MTEQDQQETVNDDKPFNMVITLKSGVQLKTKVTEYTIGRNGLGSLVTLKWTTADDSDTRIRYFDLDEVAAVHTEWLRAQPNASRSFAVGPPEPGER